MTMDKRRYLASYDYGQGGLWGFIYAESIDEITSRFPEIDVVDSPPEWMDDEYIDMLGERSEDIDGPYHGFLKSILMDREKM